MILAESHRLKREYPRKARKGIASVVIPSKELNLKIIERKKDIRESQKQKHEAKGTLGWPSVCFEGRINPD
jgi:hypothetical protein